MESTEWTVTHTGGGRFPFRIAIHRGGRPLFAVRAQAKWPGPGQQVFCLRDDTADPASPGEQIERIPIVSLTRVGRKLAVVLDRPTRKRAEFLEVIKTRADGEPYRQLFFRTEAGIRAHRSRTRVELRTRAGPDGTVVIDSGERYPWTFPGVATLRRRLAVGDYALQHEGRIIATVERKSFDNLVGDLGAVQALHQVLVDLAGAPRAALVVEAQYRDFLDPKRLAGRWPPAHLARVLAELAALHPQLPIVYAGNRKLANAWTARFFEASALAVAGAAAIEPQLSLVQEPSSPPYGEPDRPLRVDEQVREAALAFGFAFSTRELVVRCQGVPASRVKRVLGHLVEEGRLTRSGRGRGTLWEARA